MATLDEVRVAEARMLNIMASSSHNIRKDIPSVQIALGSEAVVADGVESLAQISSMASVVVCDVLVLRVDLLQEWDNLLVDERQLIEDLLLSEDMAHQSSHFSALGSISQSEDVKSPVINRLQFSFGTVIQNKNFTDDFGGDLTAGHSIVLIEGS